MLARIPAIQEVPGSIPGYTLEIFVAATTSLGIGTSGL